MPATRSSSRLAAIQATSTAADVSTGGVKRKISTTVEKRVKKSRTTDKADPGSQASSLEVGAGTATALSADPGHAGSGDEDTPVPAVLTFDFEEGKKHLISIDPRFEDLFEKMPCRPFEHLEQVHPFRALTTSILGQQISWKAARSITHKFIRLYNPDIPEELTDESREQAMEVFPSPHRVATSDVAVLRSAGLSARKAEYGGRRSEAILTHTSLTEPWSRSPGSCEALRRWQVVYRKATVRDGRGTRQDVNSCQRHRTVDGIFSLEKTIEISCYAVTGDLGVQRGLVRWFLSQHSAAHPYALSPEKVGGASSKKKKSQNVASSTEQDTLPGTGDAADSGAEDGAGTAMESVVGETSDLLPIPFTPSIKQTLKKVPKEVHPLPAGLSVSVLKGRLDGKKVKGAFLTPQEMTDLTESWKPYRSLVDWMSEFCVHTKPFDRGTAQDGKGAALHRFMNGAPFQTPTSPIPDSTDICSLLSLSRTQQCIKGISPSRKVTGMSRSSSGSGSIKSGLAAAQTTPAAANDRQSPKEIGASTSPSSADIFSLSTTLPPSHILFSKFPPNRRHRRDIYTRLRRTRNTSPSFPATISCDSSELERDTMQDAVHAQSERAAVPMDKPRFSPFNNYDLNACNYSGHFPAGHQLVPEFVDTYQLEDELGAGGYSFVMTARDRFDGYEVAVKFIIKEKVPEHCWINDPAYGKLPMEVVVLSYVNHDNIVKCLDVYEDPLYFYLVQELHGSPWDREDGVAIGCEWSPTNSGASTSSSSLATPSLSPSASVTSLVNNEPRTPPHVYPALPVSVADETDTSEEAWTGPTSKDECHKEPHRRPSYDLFECIEQSEQKRLTEEQARYVFGQVVDAVHYLDSLGIVHRDIKDENVVIDRNLKIKLIDFGSATICDPTQPPPEYEQFFGTAAYASSEILLKKKYKAAPAEVWTLGVLLSYLLAGVSPFPTVRDAVEGRIFLSESLGFKPSEDALDLMRKCLDPDPETRICIAEIKSHPWLCGPHP
ncbi:hypothetical protein NMY22_g7873 [Coprinellus aureogranulatus]|nr:hypothetical protein NMY22_g7873 [Coprinellus aureogranulatus]